MKLGLINPACAQAGRAAAFGIRMTKEVGFDSHDVVADPLEEAHLVLLREQVVQEDARRVEP